ncbi:MAG TPA: heterodisulfide reductase-related iron-sulfur binding cluster [Nitrososphaerales archaeon]|nr:heterodisulfide reductase-related iron-sulfur binding cluster [Nitrososphaerales archaeon]
MLDIPVRKVLILSYTPYAYEVMYALFFFCGCVMLYGLYRHIHSYGIGVGQFLGLAFKDVRQKVGRFLEFGVGQRKVLRDRGGGVMHGALFFGFLMLLLYTTLIFIQTDILPIFTPFVFIEGPTYLTLEFFGDVLGAAFIVGLMIAIYRRFVERLDKLETKRDDYLILGALIWIGVSGFIIEGLRLAVDPVTWAAFSPIGDGLSTLFAAAPVLAVAPTLYQVFWWAHMVSVMLLIAAAPYTKLIHVFTSGVNVAVAPVKPMGRLETPFNLQKMLESGQVETPKSFTSNGDFAPLQLLALDACTNCGRCEEVCPAHSSGRDLSPRVVVQDLGKDMRSGEKGDVFTRGIIREAELWSCTMCNACVSVCPVFIDQVDYITEFRRTLVSENRLDGKKRLFLESVAKYGNPFGLPPADRQSWLAELGVKTVRDKPGAEYLYWLGCQSSYDPRARRVAKAVVRILQEADVDFAVLGSEETCTGEPVRRMGEEGRFQELVMKNTETLTGYGVKKVVVHCAHCFNTFLNEYPEFGSRLEVIHHSQLIARLVKEGKLRPGRMEEAVTFHDPCNLGRINGVFEEPRDVLSSIGGVTLKEMGRSRTNSFCCGGGGANVWYEVQEKKKVGVIRAEEAVATGATTLAVGCPFCITMFQDAFNTLGGEPMEVKDIAELVADSLGDTK